MAQFAEEHIFNPLGMTHSRFHDSRTRLVKNRAQGHLGGKDFGSSLLAQGQLNNGNTLNYAFGLMIGVHRGFKTISRGGSFIGFKSELLHFPEQHLSIIVCAITMQPMPPS